MVFEQVCLDLESIGYEVQPFVIPACAVNAPHRRDRVWIVGHAKCGGQTGDAWRGTGQEPADGSLEIKSNVANTADIGLQGSQPPNGSQGEKPNDQQFNGRGGKRADPDTDLGGLRRCEREGIEETPIACGCGSWNQNWIEVATKLCGVVDGLAVGLDGFELSQPKHRVERLKACGNAIVWQVAYQIMLAMKEADNLK